MDFYKNKFHQYAIYSLYASCFFLPLHPGAVSICTVLMVLCWLGSQTASQLVEVLKKNSFAFCALALFILLVIGLSYTTAPEKDALRYLKKYRVLLYVPIILTLCRGLVTPHRKSINAFSGGICLALLVSFLMWFNVIPYADGSPSFARSIDHNAMVSLFAFICLHKAFTEKTRPFLYTTLFCIASYNVFWVVASRTGQVIFILLLVLFIVQKCNIKMQIIGFVCLMLALTGTYMSSDRFANKMHRVVTEIEQFERGTSSAHTSVGLRIEWAMDSLDLFQQKPLIGHGTGSFKSARATLRQHMNEGNANNPHSEYCNIAVQLGTIGLLAFFGLLLSPLLHSFSLAPSKRYLIQGIVVFMAVGCLFNSWLLTSLPSHLYPLLIAAAWWPDHRDEETRVCQAASFPLKT